MSPGEARLAALKAMGGLEQRKEECRDMRGLTLLDNLWQDAGYAARQLRAHLGFTCTATLMLALGMCASVSIFAFVDATLVKPLPYEQPSRLVGVYERVALFPRSNLSYARLPRLETAEHGVHVARRLQQHDVHAAGAVRQRARAGARACRTGSSGRSACARSSAATSVRAKTCRPDRASSC